MGCPHTFCISNRKKKTIDVFFFSLSHQYCYSLSTWACLDVVEQCKVSKSWWLNASPLWDVGRGRPLANIRKAFNDIGFGSVAVKPSASGLRVFIIFRERCMRKKIGKHVSPPVLPQAVCTSKATVGTLVVCHFNLRSHTLTHIGTKQFTRIGFKWRR